MNPAELHLNAAASVQLLGATALVSVLEEVADPLVAAIEGSRVSSEEAPHDARAKGRVPVRTKRWRWFDKSAQA